MLNTQNVACALRASKGHRAAQAVDRHMWYRPKHSKTDVKRGEGERGET